MVFCIMNEVGVVLDFIMYNVLVDIYGQVDWYEGVGELLWEMEQVGNVFDVVVYNILIEVYGRVGKY